MRSLFARLLGAAGAALIAAPFAGCGASAGSLCDAACDCSGCSPSQEDACVDDLEDGLAEADAAGCGEQAQALLDCYEDELECQDGDEVEIDGCDAEAAEVARCSGNSTLPGASTCDELAREAEARGCGNGDTQTECSGDIERASACYLANAENVCALTDAEIDAISSCLGAGSSPAPG